MHVKRMFDMYEEEGDEKKLQQTKPKYDGIRKV